MSRFPQLCSAACLVALLTFLPLTGRAGDAGTVAPPARLAARAPLLDIAIAGQRLVAVGDHGIIIFSDDDGRKWTQASVPTETMLTTVAFADAERGWAAGHGGLILGTTDGGSRWSRLDSPATEHDSFLDLFVVTPEHVLAVGAYGLFCETRDGGASWETRYVLEEDMHINRLTRASDGSILLAGESGTLAISRNGGETFEMLEPPYDGSLYGFHEIDGGDWLVHGLRGNVFLSHNEGASWLKSSIDHEVLITCAVAFSPKRLLLAGSGGWLFTSRDGGRIFTARPAGRLETIAEMIRTPGGRLAMVGDNGVEVTTVP